MQTISLGSNGKNGQLLDLNTLIGPLSSSIDHVEPWLTLHGLRLIHEKNVP